LTLSVIVFAVMLTLMVLPPWFARALQSSSRVSPTARMLAYTPPCGVADIYRHNGVIAAAISAGVFSGGLLSVVLALSVGLGTGVQIARIAPRLPAWLLVASHLPHGVFEMPALALATGAGLSSLLLLLQRRPCVTVLAGVCSVFVIVSQAMLVMSAVVECNVTPWVVRSWASYVLR
jgi:uncharacterized membrane protein SpoIIM required for sporulation